jgi:hypothetical protein
MFRNIHVIKALRKKGLSFYVRVANCKTYFAVHLDVSSVCMARF